MHTHGVVCGSVLSNQPSNSRKHDKSHLNNKQRCWIIIKEIENCEIWIYNFHPEISSWRHFYGPTMVAFVALHLHTIVHVSCLRGAKGKTCTACFTLWCNHGLDNICLAGCVFCLSSSSEPVFKVRKWHLQLQAFILHPSPFLQVAALIVQFNYWFL